MEGDQKRIEETKKLLLKLGMDEKEKKYMCTRFQRHEVKR